MTVFVEPIFARPLERCRRGGVGAAHRRRFGITKDLTRGAHKVGRSRRAAHIALSGVLLFFVACNAKVMTLSWQDTSENEEGFRIYRVANNQKIFIAEVGPNVTQYVDKNAPPDACYIVTAFNAAGESGTSNSACRSN